MWNLLSCYLSGRHEFGVSCEPGAIFLRCVHCGRRSQGWALRDKMPATVPPHPATHSVPPLHRFDTARTARGQ